MEARDFARSGFEWDTGRRPSQARQHMAGWVKVFLWTLGILIGVPAALVVIGGLYCFLSVVATA